jgi:periplasmic protein TonB
VRSLSPAVERAPEVITPRQTAAPAIDEVRFSAPRLNGAAAATLRKPPAPQAATAVVTETDRKPSPAQATAMSEADEVLFQSFRSNPAAEVKQPKPAAKAKWPLIAAISGASAVVAVLLLMIPMLSHGKAAAAKPALPVSQPTVTVIEQPDTADAKPSPSTPTVAGKPQAANNSSDNTSDAQPAPAAQDSGPSQAQAQLMSDQLNAPTKIQRASTETAQEAPPSSSFGAAGMDGLGGGNAIGSVFNNQKGPKVQAAVPKVVNVSAGVATGLLIQKTPPIYPQIAKSARVSGTVVLEANITKTGAIENLRVVSGPVMLREAALDAVRTWRYKPYKLNNEPVEIDTTINVIFSLAG